jgi:hypothetical protein
MTFKLLNQAIAVRKGVQSRTTDAVTELHRVLEKPILFNGFSKKYQPINDKDERYPDENQKVQFNVSDVVKNISKNLVDLFDIEATVDATNAQAKSDIIVDGQALIKDVPSTTLIFLEKQLELFRSDLKKAPELDQADDWDIDPNSNLYKTKPTLVHRTKKTQKAIVMYEATKEHPAQTTLITEDQTVGHWETVKISGAIPKPKKEQLLERINKVIDAVKTAREKANNAPISEMKVGSALFAYVLN